MRAETCAIPSPADNSKRGVFIRYGATESDTMPRQRYFCTQNHLNTASFQPVDYLDFERVPFLETEFSVVRSTIKTILFAFHQLKLQHRSKIREQQNCVNTICAKLTLRAEVCDKFVRRNNKTKI